MKPRLWAVGALIDAIPITRLTLPTNAVPLFNLEHRRGKHALVKDVARYLAEQRFNAALSVSLNREQGGDPR